MPALQRSDAEGRLDRAALGNAARSWSLAVAIAGLILDAARFDRSLGTHSCG